MSKQFACQVVVPDCPFEAEAATEEELLEQVARHAREVHGITEIDDELAVKVKAAIRVRA